MGLSNPNLPTSLAVVAGFLLLLLLPFKQLLVIFGLNEFFSEYLGDTLNNTVIIVFGVYMIRRFGYSQISGLGRFWPRNIYLTVIPLYFVLAGPIQYWLMDYQFYHIKPLHVLILLVSTLSVGLSEEVIFRGFVLPHLIKGSAPQQSLMAPLFMSSFIFGVLHLFNLFQSDSIIITVLAQVIYATMFGIGFGIILLGTGSIYPIGFIHGIINFFSSLDKLPGVIEPANAADFKTLEAVVSVGIVIPFLLYMLRQLKLIDRKVI